VTDTLPVTEQLDFGYKLIAVAGRIRTRVEKKASVDHRLRAESNSLFYAAAAAGQAAGRTGVGDAFARGLQQPGDFERDLGRHLAQPDSK
jgi:hypothetical protein